MVPVGHPSRFKRRRTPQKGIMYCIKGTQRLTQKSTGHDIFFQTVFVDVGFGWPKKRSSAVFSFLNSNREHSPSWRSQLVINHMMNTFQAIQKKMCAYEPQTGNFNLRSIDIVSNECIPIIWTIEMRRLASISLIGLSFAFLLLGFGSFVSIPEPLPLTIFCTVCSIPSCSQVFEDHSSHRGIWYLPRNVGFVRFWDLSQGHVWIWANSIFCVRVARDLLEANRVITEQAELASISSWNRTFATIYSKSSNSSAHFPMKLWTPEVKHLKKRDYSALERVSNCSYQRQRRSKLPD
jgi:hypothetical protein